MELHKLLEEKDVIIAKDQNGKYWVLRPLEPEDSNNDTLTLEIPSVLQPNSPFTLKARAKRLLVELGIPQHLKGFDLMVDATQILYATPDAINSITKILYPELAKLHHTTSSRVERCIRHSIFACTKTPKYQKLFNTHEHVSNSQFIAGVFKELT